VSAAGETDLDFVSWYARRSRTQLKWVALALAAFTLKLSGLLLRCLADDPEERPSMRTIRDALATLGTG
jgi:hypothetical protein